MLTEPGGPFIQLSRLNITKYATQQSIAKSLFEYIYYHEHDARYVSRKRYIDRIEVLEYPKYVVKYHRRWIWPFRRRRSVNIKIGGGKFSLESVITRWD